MTKKNCLAPCKCCTMCQLTHWPAQQRVLACQCKACDLFAKQDNAARRSSHQQTGKACHVYWPSRLPKKELVGIGKAQHAILAPSLTRQRACSDFSCALVMQPASDQAICLSQVEREEEKDALCSLLLHILKFMSHISTPLHRLHVCPQSCCVNLPQASLQN